MEPSDSGPTLHDLIVPASTATPTTAPRPVPDASIQICMAPVSAADDEAMVVAIRDIVNAVFFETESDLFVPEYKRTQSSEVADLLRKGQLALAYLAPPDATTQPPASINASQVVGCIRIRRVSPSLGEFGMLAIDAAHRGGGNGRKLVEFAEEHCRSVGCNVIQLEILVPSAYRHEFKMRLLGWYQRMGYELVRLGSFEEDYPASARMLAVPTEYRIFEKRLVV